VQAAYVLGALRSLCRICVCSFYQYLDPSRNNSANRLNTCLGSSARLGFVLSIAACKTSRPHRSPRSYPSDCSRRPFQTDFNSSYCVRAAKPSEPIPTPYSPYSHPPSRRVLGAFVHQAWLAWLTTYDFVHQLLNDLPEEPGLIAFPLANP
jgi:hypothetical protein